MKRPMFFSACHDECTGAPAETTACPPNPFFEDDRFLGLASANRTRLIGVVSGSKSISFLRGAIVSTIPVPGLVFDDGSGTGQHVEPAPKMNLPALAAVSGVFTWRFLHVGTSANPSEWRQLQAPSSGSWTVSVSGGNFTLVDAGQIPGINAIGDSVSTITKGILVGLTGTTGNWTLTKFAISANRPVVGDTTGTPGFKQLADTDFLTHPLAKFTSTFQTRTFETLDASGNAIVGGLEQAVTTGSGITDAAIVAYSPAVKRLFKAPARVFSFTDNFTAPTPAVPTTSYATIAGGHAIAPSLAINYPNVRIDIGIRFSATSANTQCALFRDGTQIYQWPVFVGREPPAFVFFDTGVTLANHTYDLRLKQGTAPVNCSVVYSFIAITTVP